MASEPCADEYYSACSAATELDALLLTQDATHTATRGYVCYRRAAASCAIILVVYDREDRRSFVSLLPPLALGGGVLSCGLFGM